jgi:hypothetical protein
MKKYVPRVGVQYDQVNWQHGGSLLKKILADAFLVEEYEDKKAPCKRKKGFVESKYLRL